MKKVKKALAMSLLVGIVSANLNACGGRIKPSSPTAATLPPTQDVPQDNFYDENSGMNAGDPYGQNMGNQPMAPVPVGIPNAQAGKFKVDQDVLNQWQAKGIAVSGGTIYVSAADASGLFKKGTVIKMSSADGKSWKDLGGKWLGSRHPIDSTVQGLAVLGGSIIAVDSKSQAYSIEASSGKVKVIKSSGGLDVAAGGGSVYISNGAVMKSDMNASAGMPLNGMMATGGIGADNIGNIYSVSGNVIKKADSNGQVMDVVTTDLAAPMDVAVDSRNGDIYVLETSMIKRFTMNGQFIISFASGASKPVGIAIDETGAVYVADAGASHKDSYVIKFSAASMDPNGGMGMGMANSYGGSSYGSSSYGSYGSSTNNAYGSYGSQQGSSDFNSYATTRRGY